MYYIFFTFYRIQKSNQYILEIHVNSIMQHVAEIIHFLLKNEIFLHLKIRWDSLDSSITVKYLQEQIIRYTPSEEHRKKCKDDLCHKNARLEFIDRSGCVTNSKSFKDHWTVTNFHQKKCTVL